MQDGVLLSQKQTDLSRREARDVAWRSLSYHADYNPALFAQLDRYRSDLDREYFALLDAIDNEPPLKIREYFLWFNETLARYLNKNRRELYDYLGEIYKSDDEKKLVIEANKMALNTCDNTITKTLANYISSSAEYNEKFKRELRAIWVILKWRYYQERAQLYPLYPAMLTPH